MLCPAMKYPLCVQQCQQIDRSCLPTLLTRMGFNKMTKRLLFFGPPKLGAYGFTDAYTDQGIAQLQMFLGHMRHNDKIAQLIYIFN